MNQNTNQNTSLGTGSMFPLLIKMAVPPMISMLIQSLYNIVDSIFVARLSSDALSAVSIIFPIQNLSLALAVGTRCRPEFLYCKKHGRRKSAGRR